MQSHKSKTRPFIIRPDDILDDEYDGCSILPFHQNNEIFCLVCHTFEVSKLQKTVSWISSVTQASWGGLVLTRDEHNQAVVSAKKLYNVDAYGVM